MAANKMMSLFSPLLRLFAGRRFNNHCLIKDLRRESVKLCYVLPRCRLQAGAAAAASQARGLTKKRD
jgi:hypothetical protein